MIYFIVLIALFILSNQLIRSSNWFREKYADVIRIRASKGNYSVVVLGSNQTKFGFNIQSAIPVYSWAMGPQSLEYDYLLTKEKMGKITEKGSLLIVICPFSSMLIRFGGIANDKYYLVLPSQSIPAYSVKRDVKEKIEYFFPIFPLFRNPRLIKQFFLQTTPPDSLENNLMNDEALKKDAKKWIEGWLKQFDMESLGMPLADKHREAIAFNQGILSKMIQLCKDHSITPYFVVMPVTDYLSDYFTKDVQQKLIYDLLSPFRSEVQLLNYFEDSRFKDKDLYFNSFFLNARGQKEFTKAVLTSIG